MNSYKRAFFYVARKKGKSLTLFLLLLLVTVSVMTGISIQNGTEKAAQTLRETIGASFTMSGNIDSLKFDGDETGYTTEKIPVPSQTVMQILSMDGIKAYNAEQHPLFQPQNGYFPLSWEKKEIPQNPSVFKGKGEGRKGKKEERDGFRNKIFKRDSWEKGWKKGREKKGKNALFQSFMGAFLSPEERRNPVVSREGEREKR